MIHLFQKKRSHINAITIPDFGLKKEKNSDTIVKWVDPEKGVSLSLNYFDKKPDLPSLIKIDELRDFYRQQIAKHNGGLIQVEVSDFEHFKVIETVFKIPQKTSGIVYLTSLTIPFRHCSYVIKIQAPEVGMTGMRDSVIAQRLFKEGVITIEKNGYENWFLDPYDKDFTEGTLMTRAEEAIYDVDFKNHPLTRSRNMLAQIKKDMQLHPDIKRLSKFPK